MHKFVRSLITEWRKLGLPFTGDTIIVAVSGGADSMSMLLAIADLVRRKKFDLRIIAAHFNHQLRGRESDADEAFVRRSAADLEMEFVAGKGRVAQKGNLEQNAREARYKFLADTARKHAASYVLTAHTKNDQAETFLLNLIRGSGLDGLGGMSTVRKLDDDIALVRPLLTWATRNDTKAYCRERDAEYRSDPMNKDEAFTRVRIRKSVLPMLAELNPRIVETLARTAELLRQGQPKAPNSVNSTSDLKTAQLRSLPRSELYATLRSWLRTERGNLRSLNLKHVASIERLILSEKSGKTVELPGGGRVAKTRGRLVFSNIKVEK